MSEQTNVIEYKCPCCGAGLQFHGGSQELACEYCGNSFELEAVRAFADAASRSSSEVIAVEQTPDAQWNEEEQADLNLYICPSCGGEILAEQTTAATFCPYCDNPTVMPQRLSGGLKPDLIIPFRTTKKDAQEAFLKLCKGKPLLPAMFTREQRIEKITGMYVPFWLFDCKAQFEGDYRATRIHTWSDSKYNYTRTEHFLLKRSASADFQGIPLDGSSKMDDTLMESIEPFDYSQIKDFDMAYLTGFLADRYDVNSDSGKERIRQRVDNAIDSRLQETLIGYSSVIPSARQLQVDHSRARYALMPVWMLNTRYNGKIYTFAMNGQTGRMTGTFPISRAKAAAWFGGVFAGVTALATLILMLA